MLHELWGSEHSGSGSKFIVGIKGGEVKHFNQPDPDTAAAKAAELSQAGWDVYFAPAIFDGWRKAENAQALNAYWCDLDVGEGKPYETAKDALAGLISWCRTERVPEPTHIVSSGYGLHCYWVLDAGIPLPVWDQTARAFKQALRVGGVKADPTRTADAASILRVPGTLNYKQADAPAEVRWIKAADERITQERFADSLPTVGPKHVVRERPDDPEWSVLPPLPPGDGAVIRERCAQIRHVTDLGGAVEEPLWRATLSVAYRCEGGDELIHAWSKGDPRYDAEQTQRKAEGTQGPATCAHFDELRPEGCAGCPLRGKITSPVQIQIAAVPMPQQAEPWRVSKVGRFVVQSGGIWYTPPAPEGEEPDPPTQITGFPLWVVQVRERQKTAEQDTDGAVILVEWVSVDGRPKRGLLPLKLLHDNAQFKAWLADAGLAIVTWDFKAMTTYISQLTVKRLREEGVVRYHEKLGWCDEHKGFIVGNRRITREGETPALVQVSNPIAEMKGADHGNLDAWIEAVNAMNRENTRKHAFALFASFGSPLLDVAGRQSALLSLAGTSAGGKTASMMLAMSVWGHPDHLFHGAQSSLNAIERQLTLNRHVPYGLDEITQFNAKQAAGLVYMAANGTGDAKLRRDGTNRAIGHWRNVTMVTTNRAILDWSQLEIKEAQRRRVLELFFAMPMDRKIGATMYNASQLHYGLACVPYMQKVIQLGPDRIRGMINEAEQRLMKKHSIPDAQRFGLWLLSAASVGAAIAQAAGLHQLPITEIIDEGAHALVDNAYGTETANEVARNTIAEWLTEMNEHINHWPDHMQGRVVDAPVARIVSPTRMYIARAPLNRLIGDAGISPRAAREVFGPPCRIDEDKRKRLSPDSPAIWCYVMDPRVLGIESMLRDG